MSSQHHIAGIILDIKNLWDNFRHNKPYGIIVDITRPMDNFRHYRNLWDNFTHKKPWDKFRHKNIWDDVKKPMEYSLHIKNKHKTPMG